MSKLLKKSVPNIDLTLKLSFSVNTCDVMDLPKYDESKKLSCQGVTAIKDVINFAHSKVHFDKHIICSPN